jgi:diguanylate cyclase (GGDEF)-like protein/PAS domain S-box-containing protein
MGRYKGAKEDMRFADFLSDIVVTFDQQFRHTYVNSAIEHFTGKKAQDFLGKTNRELGMPAELVGPWDDALGQVFRTGKTRDMTFSYSGPEGERHFQSHLIPRKALSGKVASVISVAREVTVPGQSHTTDANQRIEMDRYQAILESTDDAIVGKTLEGFVTSWNAAAEAMFGYTAAEMLGQSVMRLFPPNRVDEENFIIERLSQGEKIDHFETVRVHKSGRLVHVSVTTSPIRNARGEIIGASKIARDITPLKVERERLKLALDATGNGLWDWDLCTGKVYRSDQYLSITGYAPEEDTQDFDFFLRTVHPHDLPQTLQTIADYRLGKSDHLEFDYRLLTKTGFEGTWVMTRGRAVEHDLEGRPTRIVGTLTDITQRKKHELSQRDAATVFDNSYEGIMVINPAGLITRVNPAFTRISGYASEEVVGQSPGLLASGHEDRKFYEEIFRSLAEKPFWSGEVWCRRKNGEIYAQLLSVSTVADDRQLLQHYIGIFADISQLKAHEQELDRVAHYDPLTGTPNRRLLTDRMQQSIVRADRHQETLAVCYLDLDGFKEVNDQYGHKAGDDLLIGITHNLKNVLRSDDTLSRLGGDEFVLLLSDVGTPEECSLILERIQLAIKTPITIDAHVISVSGSIGVSLYPQDHSDADSLLRHADQAMYRAKESGKNRYHLFDPDSDQKAQQSRRRLDRLHTAMQDQEFRLFYQPKVNLRTGAIVGMEALIRWQHPEEGLLSPAAFLPHVEGTTVDHPLGKWVIATALDQAAKWMQQGARIKVSVNVSAHHLLHPEFLDDLGSALGRHPDLPSDFLELEVLESVAISDIEQTVNVLLGCHQMGVKLALDDFGTGYSSLTYLRKLPVDSLKIDQSFVRDMLTDLEDHGIVEAVIRLATAFKRQVIAEGVETLAHGAALLQMGCTLAQGYGIARPMPDHEVLPWAEQWTAQRAWDTVSTVSS